MAKKPGIYKIKINSSAVRDLLNSAEVQADLEARGDRVVAAAGPGVEAETIRGDRVSVIVSTRTTEARRNEAEDRTLTRALDAGR